MTADKQTPRRDRYVDSSLLSSSSVSSRTVATSCSYVRPCDAVRVVGRFHIFVRFDGRIGRFHILVRLTAASVGSISSSGSDGRIGRFHIPISGSILDRELVWRDGVSVTGQGGRISPRGRDIAFPRPPSSSIGRSPSSRTASSVISRTESASSWRVRSTTPAAPVRGTVRIDGVGVRLDVGDITVYRSDDADLLSVVVLDRLTDIVVREEGHTCY